MRRRSFAAGLALLAVAPSLQAAPDNSGLIEKILSQGSAQLRATLAQSRQLEIQLVYTRVRRQAGSIQLERHRYPAQASWFAAASLVKLPLAALLLESLTKQGGDLDSQLAFPGMPACAERAAELRRPQPVRRILERALVVSDDSAYNALYDFLGPQAIAERLAALSYPDVRIQARFGACGPELSRVTGPWRLSDRQGRLLAEAPQRPAFALRRPLEPILRGVAWMQAGKRIAGPKDFTLSNALSLSDAQDMLIALKYPQSVPPERRFALSEAQREFLLSRMRMTPQQSALTSLEEKALVPELFKLLGVGKGRWPEDLHVTNKVGWAYGYLSDVAHLQQGTHECFVSCAMLLNRDGVLNDGIYEYDSIGRPFMAEAGRLLLALS